MRRKPDKQSINELNSDLFTKEQPDERFRNPKDARKKAMDYLARREYGQLELERKLVKAGYDPGVVNSAVLQLRGDGLQDDRRFVDNFVQSRISQGKGPVRIHVDLGQRGIDSHLVDDVLEELSVDWFDLARAVRQKKFGPALPTEFKEKAKQMRFLQYRGFEQSHIQAALKGVTVTAAP